MTLNVYERDPVDFLSRELMKQPEEVRNFNIDYIEVSGGLYTALSKSKNKMIEGFLRHNIVRPFRENDMEWSAEWHWMEDKDSIAVDVEFD